MSDPTDSAKAPATSRTTASPAAPTQGGPAPAKVDLTEWKAPAPAPTAQTTAAQTARARDAKVEWGQLAGIRGMLVTRISGVRHTTKVGKSGKAETYEWVGTTVHLPSSGGHPKGQDVFCLTGTGTVAGKALVDALLRGVFDDVSDAKPVAVAVRAQFSDDYPDGRPIALLTFG